MATPVCGEIWFIPTERCAGDVWHLGLRAWAGVPADPFEALARPPRSAVGRHGDRSVQGQGVWSGANAFVSYTALLGRNGGAFYIDFCGRGLDLQKLGSTVNAVVHSLRIGPGPAGVGAQAS